MILMYILNDIVLHRFDSSKILGYWELNLEDIYERSAAILIMTLVANHLTIDFTRFAYDSRTPAVKEFAHNDPSVKRIGAKADPVDIVVSISTEKTKLFNEKQKILVNNLEMMREAAANFESASKLFEELDADGSGELDVDEFSVLLDRMGMPCTPDDVQMIMDQYDADMSK
jgi:hypothetical protein